jgi:hypothetical protein
MKFRARYVAWLFPLLLTACDPFHKPKPMPDQLLAPPIANLPRPSVSHPDLSDEAAFIPLEPIEADEDVDEEPLAPVHHHHLPRPVPQVAVPPPAPDTPSVSAIGQLSSGEPSDLRVQTDQAIASTEHSLNSLGRSLKEPEKKTAAQIRAYLKQAREALITGDVDGAHTLVAKARVLLDELTQ